MRWKWSYIPWPNNHFLFGNSATELLVLLSFCPSFLRNSNVDPNVRQFLMKIFMNLSLLENSLSRCFSAVSNVYSVLCVYEFICGLFDDDTCSSSVYLVSGLLWTWRWTLGSINRCGRSCVTMWLPAFAKTNSSLHLQSNSVITSFCVVINECLYN